MPYQPIDGERGPVAEGLVVGLTIDDIGLVCPANEQSTTAVTNHVILRHFLNANAGVTRCAVTVQHSMYCRRLCPLPSAPQGTVPVL